MIKHQYSARFKTDLDEFIKHQQFQRSLGEFFKGFIECYPHLIKKEPIAHMPGHEMWILKFAVEIPDGNTPAPYDELKHNQITVCPKCGKDL